MIVICQNCAWFQRIQGPAGRCNESPKQEATEQDRWCSKFYNPTFSESEIAQSIKEAIEKKGGKVANDVTGQQLVSNPADQIPGVLRDMLEELKRIKIEIAKKPSRPPV